MLHGKNRLYVFLTQQPKALLMQAQLAGLNSYIETAEIKKKKTTQNCIIQITNGLIIFTYAIL